MLLPPGVLGFAAWPPNSPGPELPAAAPKMFCGVCAVVAAGVVLPNKVPVVG